MTNKYMKYERKPTKRSTELHPVWRGIGCLLFIIVPVLSYAITTLLVPLIYATGVLPREIFLRVRFPEWAYETMIISGPARFLSSIQYFWATIIFFFIVLLVLAGLVSILYSAIYQSVGPARYTAMDAPPSKHRAKSYRR